VKIEKAPRIDGKLDDEAWSKMPVASDFIQNFPRYGIEASQKVIVRIGYDNSAIYVAAHLLDDPSLIRRQITPRDGEAQTDVDYFSVFFDTYNDDQNGFQFLVTAANVQTDARLAPNLGGNFNNFGDKAWDAVWESEVTMADDGWIVEMRIPYISLRFARKDVQDWGLQFLRYIRRHNESSYWNPVNPEVNGFVNQFGLMQGLRDIEPPLRLSFSPYVSTGVRNTPLKNTSLTEWLHSGGMDVKYGINESFTLDATLIPDFGQVVSDNVVNNLTPYEIRFQENRPFFTEGTELFNKAGLFYSRRVGDIPEGYSAIVDTAEADPNIEILKNPARTQLYNAIKFSGRTRKKLGIGVFNALTAPMHASIRNRTTGATTKIETEPLSNYNIIVLDQPVGGRSYVTFTNTSVIRNRSARDANVSAVDWAFYDKNNSHQLQGTLRYSRVSGMESYDGYNTTLRWGKVSGSWQYLISGNIESADYDPNDLGFLVAPNEVSYRAALTYRRFEPTRTFVTYNYSFNTGLLYLYNPYRYSRASLSLSGFWVFRNFWDISLTSGVLPGWEHNYFELRTPGRYLAYPSNYYLELEGSSDSRRKLFGRYDVVYARAPKFDNDYRQFSLGARYRFSNRFSLDVEGTSRFEGRQLGYAFTREPSGEPIVGFRDNREFVSVFSGIYHFTSRMNITFRARHYWNLVNYISFHNVDASGKLTPRGFIAGRDENVNIFNVDAFLTWDFRLGSRLVLGYKNWLGEDEMVTLTGKSSYLRNLEKVFDLRHGNEATVRFIYFLDYNQLRRRR